MFFGCAQSANWAQTSGKISQNLVNPSVPGPNNPHWQGRYGMTVVLKTNSTSLNFGTIFLMGGDTYNDQSADHFATPGNIDLRWSNGYKNDVWTSRGADWLVKADPRLRNAYQAGRIHQKIPRVRSTMKWIKINHGLLPPPAKTYETWLYEWEQCQNPASA
eukprot:gene13419-28456_t